MRRDITDMDIPSLDEESVEETVKKVRSSVSILSPHNCDYCGRATERDSTEDYAGGAFYKSYPGVERPTWYCSACDKHFAREDGSDLPDGSGESSIGVSPWRGNR